MMSKFGNSYLKCKCAVWGRLLKRKLTGKSMVSLFRLNQMCSRAQTVNNLLIAADNSMTEILLTFIHVQCLNLEKVPMTVLTMFLRCLFFAFHPWCSCICQVHALSVSLLFTYNPNCSPEVHILKIIKTENILPRSQYLIFVCILVKFYAQMCLFSASVYGVDDFNF